MDPAREPAPDLVAKHQTVRKNRGSLSQLMLLAGVLIYTRDAPMGRIVTTPMSAAWTDAEASTPHTNTPGDQHAQGGVIPNPAPDEDGTKDKKSPEWRHTATVPVAEITNCLSVWEEELKNDPDREFILDGICNGFRLIDPEADPPGVRSCSPG